jgi:hypothetical protein
MLNFIGEKLRFRYKQLPRARSNASSVLPRSFYSEDLEYNHCSFPANDYDWTPIGLEVHLLRTQSHFDRARTRTL